MGFKAFYEQASFEDKIREKYEIDHVFPNNIGYSPTQLKWYGWSHRAIAGFGKGSKCKVGDCAFVPSNKEEFKKSLEQWYSDKYYTNVEYKVSDGGVCVKYELHKKDGEIFKTNRFYKYPKKWGKGEWVALDLNDAKEMAMDFAKSVR